MTAMSTVMKAAEAPSIMGPPRKLDGGIGFLSKEDWFYIQAFVLMSIYDNPTTPEKMAARLKMASTKDPRWTKDFTDTVGLYKSLKDHCETFWNVIKPGLIGLADDIVAYVTRTDAVYTRLIGVIDAYDMGDSGSDIFKAKLQSLAALWASNDPSQEARSVKDKFKTGIQRLYDDADQRAKKATALVTKLVTFRDDLLQSKSDFNAHTAQYELKYGTESKEVTTLKAELASIMRELGEKRKKESDEVIVLSTTPTYLVVPVIGWFAIVGVLIGVGIDLAYVRERIKTLVEKSTALSSQIESKEAFMANYKTVQDLTTNTAKQLETVIPYVSALADGWTSMKNQLASLVGFLASAGGGAKAEDFFAAVLDLEASKTAWADLKARAQHFSENATIREAPSTKDLVESVKVVAA